MDGNTDDAINALTRAIALNPDLAVGAQRRSASRYARRGDTGSRRGGMDARARAAARRIPDARVEPAAVGTLKKGLAESEALSI